LREKEICNYIEAWLNDYVEKAGLSGFIIGISGGIDSALTSTLCARTGKKTLLLNMPIRQTKAEYDRAKEHIEDLKMKYSNVQALEIDLTSIFDLFETTVPSEVLADHLSMANSRARIRMTTLYAVGQTNNCLVVGTGNKIEDFGVGFYTKYGDGGVDISPIADLTKTDVKKLASELNVVSSILLAKPTDGLWEDGRSDEDQLGASYPELEWAMDFKGDYENVTEREKEVLNIYKKYNRINKHKMEPIPVCLLPNSLK